MTTPSQSEQDLLLPLGDHQHSTRALLAHDSSSALFVRQSIDYSPFGLTTSLLGPTGVPNLSALGLLTAFGHHGSVTDPQTGLQHKSQGPGGRWYLPDLGRFISEDQAQEGANWYKAFGNNPIIYADPTGLFQQGHPLAGGYSGGKVAPKPTVPLGTFSTTLGAGPYNGSFGAPSRVVAAPTPARSSQLINNFTTLNDVSSFTRNESILDSLVAQRQEGKATIQKWEQDRQTVVSVQQLNSGDPVKTFGILGHLLPSVAPSYRVTYADGRSVIQLGGEPSTAEAIGIPGAGALAARTAPAVLKAGQGVVDVASRVRLGFDNAALSSGPLPLGGVKVSVAPKIITQAESSGAARIATAVQKGRAGEVAAGITGPKTGVTSPLSGKTRFPDLLSREVLREVKNVAQQGLTGQIKDYIAIAKQNSVPFELLVRSSTILSRPLQAAREAGDVVIKYLNGL